MYFEIGWQSALIQFISRLEILICAEIFSGKLSRFVYIDIMSEEQSPAKYFDLDEVLEKEVKFGKFQVLIFFFIAFPIFLNGISSSSYIFTAGTLNYR